MGFNAATMDTFKGKIVWPPRILNVCIECKRALSL